MQPHLLGVMGYIPGSDGAISPARDIDMFNLQFSRVSVLVKLYAWHNMVKKALS